MELLRQVRGINGGQTVFRDIDNDHVPDRVPVRSMVIDLSDDN